VRRAFFAQNALLGYVLGAPLTVKRSQLTRFIDVNVSPDCSRPEQPGWKSAA
jgi:hypothetical protein